ncbi:hypothetical protein [Catellatospora methionotrophica]|uniref:hypothetical protein n=1 Tax=Catellatospora methionotrophica TaxID=121620 RepID=UPI00340E32A9
MTDPVDRVTRERKTLSLPVDLAEYAERRGQGNTSAYVAGLIEKDRRLAGLRQMFAEHGYVGDRAITEEGVAAMRQSLYATRSRRAASRRQAA